MYFPSTPISYAVEITYNCNHSCPGCANVLGQHRQEELRNWRELFDRIAPPDNRRQYAELLRITGGEPTLHPEFGQIIRYIDTFGILHATFTNGRWTDPDSLIELFQPCQNFVGLLVSLHGSTAETHQAFTHDALEGFELICDNIRHAAEAGLEVFTNTVLTRDNCGQLDDIIALSQGLGAAYAVFNRYLGKPHPIEPGEAQLRQAIRRIEALQREGVHCRIGDCIPPCFEKNSSVGSNGGIEHCAISPTGMVRPENLTSYAFGNLCEQSIEAIWRSERAQWYRQQLPEKCLECVELPRCRGGCRSVTVEYELTGDPLMQEPIHTTEPETLELDPAWKPAPFFNIRPEPFGYLLARYNWSVPVTHEAKALVEAINGQTTLAQLHRQFGDEVLDFIGQLYREGCVGFEE